MGALGSRFQASHHRLGETPQLHCMGSSHVCECKKRKRSSHCECDSDPDEDDSLLDTPCRKKLKSTSKYIYQTLFLNGENSDIRICALDQEWNLHKVYLCQAGYFSSMFSGSWKESNMMIIQLEIPDQNIDTEALQVVFGSLYRDDVLIKPSRVVSILAAACMLQLHLKSAASPLSATSAYHESSLPPPHGIAKCPSYAYFKIRTGAVDHPGT